ncbi:hypothetical protein A3E45_00420 [Candidatus Daviesbacteria bacterium RIFCSPHIGHO2_12_FULL_43_11]|uniref:Uncharacterized protein n=2 Tax=Candidatus Daviesiibacteriota TaxID=1752718 RepID=A0A1F5K483_9BACT|nr:MAG: hypothetical protein UV41_C0006G0002 [Candidatus Daviesbacteria bacterium GW2011_GWA2_42_7]OGE19996.1 MAG: hypothetical protein A2874_00735 [Candidatus Daviesbacteria bacterium RIFCSPHIGHO2_01_FULL_43_17]OGE35746.1 MAG: hypothetical protein A3E45_00420 [Candidatus Daviesbacteria bacterium RIFCSPHIGHO2_12_FULL_43_11]OGE69659.1 MAG: hypothetical protein A3J21_03120 [Candidatus Daviesbacteria bacterium RIFCSPLOWO2_02_FULL_43_11]
MEDRDKVLWVLAGIGTMGFLWALVLVGMETEVPPSANFVLYVAVFAFVWALMCRYGLGLYALSLFFIGCTAHIFLSGLAAMITLEVLSPVVQGGAGLFWLIILSLLLLQARSHKLPQRG